MAPVERHSFYGGRGVTMVVLVSLFAAVVASAALEVAAERRTFLSRFPGEEGLTEPQGAVLFGEERPSPLSLAGARDGAMGGGEESFAQTSSGVIKRPPSKAAERVREKINARVAAAKNKTPEQLHEEMLDELKNNKKFKEAAARNDRDAEERAKRIYAHMGRPEPAENGKGEGSGSAAGPSAGDAPSGKGQASEASAKRTGAGPPPKRARQAA